MSNNQLNIPKDKPIVIFTGAGISYDAPTCLPLGGQLVDAILGHTIPTELLPVLKKYSLRPEVLMQVLLDYIGDSVLAALFVLSKGLPNRNHALLELLRVNGVISKIVTTNLDLCHEQLILDGNASQILHLHGIADDKRSIMYALDQVSNRKAQELKSTLINNLSNSTVIFLGYSGRDDFDIAPALREMPFDVRFIWIEHDPDVKNCSKNHGFSLSDARYILENRPPESVYYCKCNTWSFLHKWALNEGLADGLKQIENDLNPSLFNAKKISKEVTSLISEPLKKLSEETGRLVISEFLFKFLNRPEEADRLIKEINIRNLDEDRVSSYYRVLGYAKYFGGNYRESEKAFQKCLELGGRDGQIIRNLADIAYRRNNFKSAENLLLKAIELTKFDIQDGKKDKGQILVSYGLLLKDTERLDEAIEAFNEAEMLLREEGDIYGLSNLLNNKGLVYMDALKLHESEETLLESLRLRKQIHHVQGICYSYLNIGLVNRILFCRENDLDLHRKAYDFFAQALKALDDGAIPDRALIKKNIGDLYLDNLEFNKANEQLTTAYELFCSLDGQEGPQFSTLLSILELKLLMNDRRELDSYLSELQFLSGKGQLNEKLSWYKLIKNGIKNGFLITDTENMYPTNAWRLKQLTEAQS